MRPAISIVVPCYQVEQYLDRCVKSLILQTFDNIEILLVDDGSTDKTPELCDNYAIKYSKIKVIHKKNGGLSDARNVGIEAAKGRYICFIDSDDYINSSYCEIMFDIAEKMNVDIVVCGYRKVFKYEYYNCSNNNLPEIMSGEEAVRQLILTDKLMNYAWNKLYRIELFDDIKYPFGKRWEDIGVTYKLFDKSKRIAYISNKLYYYMQRKGSITSSNNLTNILNQFELLSIRYNDLTIKYPELKNVLSAQLCAVSYNCWSYLLTSDLSEDRESSEVINCCDYINRYGKQLLKNLNRCDNFKIKVFLYCYARDFLIWIVKFKRFKKIFKQKKSLLYIKFRHLKLEFLCLKGFFSDTAVYYSSRPICWLIGVPDHKNLGDHAIAYASKEFISEVIPNYVIQEISETEFYNKFYKMKKNIKHSDIIVLQGGGNFGNQYIYTENIRRLVIAKCLKNRIIMFPQTIYFTNDLNGENEKKYTQKLYSKANVSYFAREKYSYELMVKMFGHKKVFCVPDIVLFLEKDFSKNVNIRDGIISCFRDDVEGVLSQKDKYIVNDICLSLGRKISYIDTLSDKCISSQDRKNEFNKLLKKFSKAELVITDRLHGMIFAAITHTPCIAFSNYNYKVKGVYEWIKCISNIVFLDNINSFSSDLVFDLISDEDKYINEWDNILNKFEPLIKLLQGEMFNERD